MPEVNPHKHDWLNIFNFAEDGVACYGQFEYRVRWCSECGLVQTTSDDLVKKSRRTNVYEVGNRKVRHVVSELKDVY